MVPHGRAKSQGAGVANILWVAAPTEMAQLEGHFELAIGNAFHRLKRQTVAARIFSWLRPGGGPSRSGVTSWLELTPHGSAA
jgi:hypothetical protein